jgi:hypothetical protein
MLMRNKKMMEILYSKRKLKEQALKVKVEEVKNCKGLRIEDLNTVTPKYLLNSEGQSVVEKPAKMAATA